MRRASRSERAEDSYRQGSAFYHQALTLDPDDAVAWGASSNSSANLGVAKYVAGEAFAQDHAQVRIALQKEASLTPDAAKTHVNRGYLLSIVDNVSKSALAEYEQASATALAKPG